MFVHVVVSNCPIMYLLVHKYFRPVSSTSSGGIVEIIGSYNWTWGAGFAPFVSPYMGSMGSLFRDTVVPMIGPRVVMGCHGSHYDVMGSGHYFLLFK